MHPRQRPLASKDPSYPALDPGRQTDLAEKQYMPGSGAQLQALVDRHIKDNPGVRYGDALTAVMQQFPSLAQQYEREILGDRDKASVHSRLNDFTDL